jgi:hypothetical protein
MLIIIAVAIMVFAVFLGLSFAGRPTDSASFEERLREMAREPGKIDLTELELSKPFSERVILPIVERVGAMIAKITPQEVLKEATKKIQQSGMKLRPPIFVATQVVLAVVFPCLLGITGIMAKFGAKKASVCLSSAALSVTSCPISGSRGKSVLENWISRGNFPMRSTSSQSRWKPVWVSTWP